MCVCVFVCACFKVLSFFSISVAIEADLPLPTTPIRKVCLLVDIDFLNYLLLTLYNLLGCITYAKNNEMHV